MTLNEGSITEDDYLRIIELHSHLVDCKSLAELNRCLEHYLHPLIGCDSTMYDWTGSGLTKNLKITEFSGVTRDEAKQLELNVPFSSPNNIIPLTETRSLIAYAIDVDKIKSCQKNLPYHAKKSPANVPPKGGRTITTYALSVDKFESDLRLGVIRWAPNEKALPTREVRIMELVIPILLQTIKTIALSGELMKYASLCEVLADTPECVALVRNDMKIVYSNTSFRNLIFQKSLSTLPPELESALKWEMDKRSQYDPKSFPNVPCVKLQETTFRLSIDLVNKDDNTFYLLRLKPESDVLLQMNLRMEAVNLSSREKEICLLIKDGLTDSDIASRLSISNHTVRTQIKSIHNKFGTNSRAELISTLHKTS